MNKSKFSQIDLRSDVPLANPSDDEYGFASFASQLASAIIANQSPQGLVLAIHGKWGSGKSSLLNFIKFDLNHLPESERPVVVDFNPWWFEGRDQIAAQLLEQFAAQLPDRLKYLRPVALALGKYSKQLASVAAVSSGHAWIKVPLDWLIQKITGSKFFAKKTDIPQIKEEVSKAIKSSGKRFVFFVDDIDRLTPDETRDLFRAVKALADFPGVIYVLSFDRTEVAKSLSAALKMDGDAYLEKIVQAPFHLPAVDRNLLNRRLFKGLDSIIESKPLPFGFDQSRWTSIYYDGLDRFIEKPRDIVRILNTMSVTYPPLSGEVNAVDFIALEFLRVFHPEVYRSIRDGKDFFCGDMPEASYKKSADNDRIKKWQEQIPEAQREHLSRLVGKIFPKVSKLLGNSFPSYNTRSWRRELRPCSLECFDVYFQFGLPPGSISRAELENLANQSSSRQMADLLIDAKNVLLPDGHTKARDLVERLSDLKDLSADQAERLIDALILIGGQLLIAADERGGFFSIPNRWRIDSAITKLMERIEIVPRQELFRRLAIESTGLWGIVGLVDLAVRAVKEPSKAPDSLVGFDPTLVSDVAAIVGKRLDDAPLELLMQIPDLDFIVYRWHSWGTASKIRSIFAPMLVDDERLLSLVDKFVLVGTRTSGSETTEIYRLSMTSLNFAVDIQQIEPRIASLKARNDLTRRQRDSLNYFLDTLPMIRDGKDPDEIMYADSNSQ